MSPKRPLFREVNERIREVNATFGLDHGHQVILLCECNRPGCVQRLEVPGEVYDIVRGDLQRFLVAPGHEEVGENQVVVAGSPTYLVIAMRPEPV